MLERSTKMASKWRIYSTIILGYGVLPFAIGVIVEHYTQWSFLFCVLAAYLGTITLFIIPMFVLVGGASVWSIFYRTNCRNCGQKKMRAGKMCIEDGDTIEGMNKFMLSQCEACDYQQKVYRNREREIEMNAPGSDNYWTSFVRRKGKASE